MEEVKISKKSKVGILLFVTAFEEFAELAETIFRNAERRGDLDKAYVKLIRAVFVNGETTWSAYLLAIDDLVFYVMPGNKLLNTVCLFSGEGSQ